MAMRANAWKSNRVNRSSRLHGHVPDPVDDARHTVQATTIPPANCATKRLLASQLIAGLSKNERVILALHYRERLAQREIALVMDLPVAAVRRLHQRALRRLRGGLAEPVESRTTH
jgi:RNA polymerase sigma factor (sigma-70 family)